MENKRINIKCFNTIEYKMLEVFLNGLYDKGLYIEKIINYEIYFSEKPTKKYIYSTAITNIKDEDEIFEYIDFCESVRKGSEVISFKIYDIDNIVSDENIKLFNRIINE